MHFAVFVLILSLLFAIFRFIISTSPWDKMICLDLMTVTTFGGLLLVHINFPESRALDVAVILSLLSFFGPIVLGRVRS